MELRLYPECSPNTVEGTLKRGREDKMGHSRIFKNCDSEGNGRQDEEEL